MRVTSVVAIIVAGLLWGGCHQAAKPPESGGQSQAQVEPQPVPVQAAPFRPRRP